MSLLQFIVASALTLEQNGFQHEINRQIEGFNSIAFVSNNMERFQEQLKVSTPSVLRNWSDEDIQRISVGAYILDLETFSDWSKIYMKLLRKTAETKYIVLIGGDFIEKFKSDVYEIGLCDVVLISIEERVVNLRNPCRGVGEFTEMDLMTNNCTYNASFIHLPPNTIAKTDQVLMGYEGQLVGAVMDHLGINIELYINYHEAGFGSFEPPTLLCGDMYTRKTLLALGGIYPFYERIVHADVLYGCGTMQVIWTVPSKAGPGRATWYVILVQEFTATTWATSLVFYIALFLVLGFFEKSKMDTWGRPFFILGLLLGQKRIDQTQKIFTISVVFFGMLFSYYYQAVLSSKLTLPSEIPEITNMEELFQSELDLVSTPFIRRVVQSVGENTFDLAKAELSRKCRAVAQSSHNVLLDIAHNRSSALARHDSFVKYLYNTDPNLSDKIHFMEEPVTDFYPIIMMPKYSCLSSIMQKHFRRLCETGIGVKWFKDITTLRKSADRDGPKMLDLEHIRGFLLLLAIGWSLAVISFGLELSVNTICTLKKKFAIGKGAGTSRKLKTTMYPYTN